MINHSPNNLDKFPVPATGQKIPAGWFSRLVNFINSLVLHGDNQYLAVTHDKNGTTIRPTTALIDVLNRAGTPPAAGGGGSSYGIEATIDGSTASIALVEGGTASSISLIPTAPVTLTARSNGELIIGSTASGGGIGYPNYSSLITTLDYTNAGSWISYNQDVWLVGIVQLFVSNSTSTAQITLEYQPGGFQYILGQLTGPISGDGLSVSYPVMLPVKANTSFRFLAGYPPGAYSTISTDFYIKVLATI